LATYDWLFNIMGLRNWCDTEKSEAPMSMAQLLAQAGNAPQKSVFDIPFPSLDELHKACGQVPQTRDVVLAMENAFRSSVPYIRNGASAMEEPTQWSFLSLETYVYLFGNMLWFLLIPLGLIAAWHFTRRVGLTLCSLVFLILFCFGLNPITAPLSWSLDGSLYLFVNGYWYAIIASILIATWYFAREKRILFFNAFCLLFFAFVDHFEPAMQTFAVILVCAVISALVGIPIGIMMSKSDRVQKTVTPVLDLLQTLPTFVYLIPLIFIFPIGESRLYGIAIILYAIVPIIRLTDLGIRLVDQDVIEAGNAFGMKDQQMLTSVELPLARPNIMAGLNQTIMMSLAMVVIASMVTAPGLGVLVLRGIRNLELGV